MLDRNSLRASMLAALLIPALAQMAQAAPRFEISYAASARAQPVTGRLILVLAREATPEPRMGMGSPMGPAMFGVDVDQLRPGQVASIDQTALGYPTGLADLPPGQYYAQAILNVYTKVQRESGPAIWVHVNDGSLEWINTAAGNLYSDVQKVDVSGDGTIRIELAKVMKREPVKDTEWLKHVKVQSRKLTKFWGYPVFIHATVLLPKGYAGHEDVKYPSVYTLGHGTPFFMSTDPAEGNGGKISPRTGLESGYDFFQTWTSEGFPRFIAVSLEQQTPFFLDSYSVNSANNGPYGDAVVEELIPALEKQFRMIGKPYARLVEGASTSGWQTLALQLRNPDFFGGAWVLQPDPIDFRHYQQNDIYKDENAFSVPTGPFTTTERPMKRTVAGQVQWTMRQMSLFEEVLGTHGRSEYQLEGWEAVYGPVGADGYPKPLWDKLTGRIDHEVASYMRDNGYDLRVYAEKNWATIGPKLIGKLHFFCGDMDDFYLNLAVYDFQEFLKSTKDPHYEAEFTFGRPMKGHSWHAWTWGDMLRQMADYIDRNAPPGGKVPR
jgi:hypothetical protein